VKIAGRKIEGPNVEIVVIPRGNGESHVFRAMAILDYSPLDKICMPPRPPIAIRPGGERIVNVEDPTYKQALVEYGQKRTAWLVLQSLRLGTPDLEWETVKYDDSNTWVGYVDELRSAGFTENEIVRIVRAAAIANALDDAKLEEARKSFLAGLGARVDQSFSREAEPNNTPSGEPASDLA
jgi:hypothetical protein